MNSRLPKLRRRLFAGISVLSLILCVATVGLWVRSYGFADYIYLSFPGERQFDDWIRHSRTFGALQRCGIVQIELWRDSSIADRFECVHVGSEDLDGSS
jgi:hypothetical protein